MNYVNQSPKIRANLPVKVVVTFREGEDSLVNVIHKLISREY
jgi:hypothetical protein